MKKYFAFIVCLICSTATGAFAEWYVQIYSEFDTQLFGFISPMGLAADKEIVNAAGNEVPNTTGAADLAGTWVLGGNTGSFLPKGGYTFLAPWNTPTVRNINYQVNGRISFIYYAGPIHAWIGANIGNSVPNLIYGGRPSLNTIFDWLWIDIFKIQFSYPLVDFRFGWDNVFDLAVPSYSQLSALNQFTYVNEIGVLVPGGEWIYQNLSNMLAHWNSADSLNAPAQYTSFITSFKHLNILFGWPLTINAALGIDNRAILSLSDVNPKQLTGGITAKGTSLLNLIDYDLVYKIRGGDPTVGDYDEDVNPGGGKDGQGGLTHFMSLSLGNTTLIPYLSVSFAYSVMFPSYEDRQRVPGDTTSPELVTKKGPVYNGIDLRLRYTGIRDWQFYQANKVTFAHAAEPDYNGNGDETGISVGFNRTLNRYQSQNWLALYNALYARYAISRDLYVELEFINRLGLTSDFNSDKNRGGNLSDWGKREKLSDIFQTTATISIDFTAACILQTGVSAWIENHKTTYSDYREGMVTFPSGAPRSWQSGGIGFSIPVRMLVHFL